MPQIIALGEALVEIMRPDSRTPLDQSGVFMGPYASGAPAIFAAAAARLGLDVGFIGSVGKDGFGRLLQRRLEAEKVDTKFLHEDSWLHNRNCLHRLWRRWRSRVRISSSPISRGRLDQRAVGCRLFRRCILAAYIWFDPFSE